VTKTCNKCGETKPATDFHRDAKGRDGRRTTCATCDSNRQAVRRKPTPRAREWAACAYLGCRSDHEPHPTSGLCPRHHAMLTNCRESPLDLTDGEWVRVGGVRKWVAA
jgi:hypothetical protein